MRFDSDPCESYLWLMPLSSWNKQHAIPLARGAPDLFADVSYVADATGGFQFSYDGDALH